MDSASLPLRLICYRFREALEPGVLIRRYKRFLADIELGDGRIVTAHCPNSGSMLGCLEEGAQVYCSRSNNPRRRTVFTWEMIRINDGWVGINTIIPNKLVAQAAVAEALPIFEGVTGVRTEVRIAEHTRIDLVAERPGGPMIVEVKNVTLVRDGKACFPDAVTARGAKHLDELVRLTKQGFACVMVYVVQREDAQFFGPADDIDPHYARTYEVAKQAGVIMTAVQAAVAPEAICLQKELPLIM